MLNSCHKLSPVYSHNFIWLFPLQTCQIRHHLQNPRPVPGSVFTQQPLADGQRRLLDSQHEKVTCFRIGVFILLDENLVGVRWVVGYLAGCWLVKKMCVCLCVFAVLTCPLRWGWSAGPSACLSCWPTFGAETTSRSSSRRSSVVRF